MSDPTRRRFLLVAAGGLAGVGCRVTAGRSTTHSMSTTAGGSTEPTTGRAEPAAPSPSTTDVRDRFLAAVVAGETTMVSEILQRSPELVDSTDEAGRSALVLAYLHGNEAMAKLLLEHKPTVGVIEAVMIPDWPQVEKLVAADPDSLHAWYPVGGTPLYASARAGRPGLWRLQSMGADTNGNPRGRDGVTPAYGALECPDPIDAWCTLVDLLSNAGDVNAPQRDGDTLLHVAARRGDPTILRYLLRRGADVHARDSAGRTPLAVAERAGHAVAIALLRDPDQVSRDDMRLRRAYDASGAPVVWPELDGLTREQQGQFTGSSHGQRDAVRDMLRGDSRFAFSVSSQGELAIEACGHTGNHEIMRILLDHGVPMSLCTALSLGDLRGARALLQLNPGGIHERGPHDFAVMWYPAIGGGSIDAQQLLLEFGAPVDQHSRGTTALHWAAARGQLDLAHYLLEHGADVSALSYSFDRAGLTPLGLAQERGQDKMVAFLRERGAM